MNGLRPSLQYSDKPLEDCLFEYSFWDPMDICDYARSYSLTNHFGGVVGANPPTASRPRRSPATMWNEGLSLTRCYFKGSSPSGYSVVGELASNCVVTDSSCATGSGFAIGAGSYGNRVEGSFADAATPSASIFTSGWTGSGTSYTPSPYDP